MRGQLIAIVFVIAAPGLASAEPVEPDPAPPSSPSLSTTPPSPATTTDSATATRSAGEEIGDQGIGADLGVAIGNRVTPGGLRISGHYLYQLSEQDWFDGTASFTFGGGAAACFHDRNNVFVCEHGLADGNGFEVAANVRRVFAPQGTFRPFARVGVGIGYARFKGDDVTGLVIPLHAGGGVRANVADSVAVVAQAELALGVGDFGHSLGAEPQLGLAIVAGAEFRLR